MKLDGLKTIKEISKLAGVSRPTVYSRLDRLKEEVGDNIDQYIKILNDTTYLTGKGQAYIFKSLGVKVEDFRTKKKEDSNKDPESNTIKKALKVLEKELEEKNQQLKEKDKQIADLLEIISTDTKARALGSVKDKENSSILNYEDQEEKRHPSRWERFKQFLKGK